jgi:Na+-transporting NADH:ubiquinone oxidoreductase subunit NqrC
MGKKKKSEKVSVVPKNQITELNKQLTLLLDGQKYIENKLKKSEQKGWKIFVVVLPILLTAVFGFITQKYTSRVEESLQKELVKNDNIIAASLNVSQKLYNERFNLYMEIYSLILALHDEIVTAEYEEGISPKLISLTSEMYRKSEKNKLILSDSLYNPLAQLWSEPMKLRSSKSDRTLVINKCLHLISKIIAQMKKELYVNELGDFEIFNTAKSNKND